MKVFGFLLAAQLASLSAQEINTGKILVADPKLPDPNFSHAVVLLVHVGDDGIVGLILNRASSDGRYWGGPVENDSAVFALLRSQANLKEGLKVADDVYLLTDRQFIEKKAHSNKESRSFRIFEGYAGWGPDQLDQELAAGAWTILPWKAETVFDSEPGTLWDRLNEKGHLRIAELLVPQSADWFDRSSPAGGDIAADEARRWPASAALARPWRATEQCALQPVFVLILPSGHMTPAASARCIYSWAAGSTRNRAFTFDRIPQFGGEPGTF